MVPGHSSPGGHDCTKESGLEEFVGEEVFAPMLFTLSGRTMPEGCQGSHAAPAWRGHCGSGVN
eukprot:5108214-Prorocentrum_lima.AAC.1